MFVNENHGHTLSSHLGCRDAKRRNLVPCHYALGRVGRFARAFTYTVHSLYLYSRFLYSIHHSQSSQSVSIYDREIGAKISLDFYFSISKARKFTVPGKRGGLAYVGVVQGPTAGQGLLREYSTPD